MNDFLYCPPRLRFHLLPCWAENKYLIGTLQMTVRGKFLIPCQEEMEVILDDSAFRFAVAMAACETFADYNLKLFAKDTLPGNIFAGLAGYGGVVYFLQAALRKEKLFRVNNYWNALTSVSNTVLGVSMGESITWSQFLGVVLIVTGILLV